MIPLTIKDFSSSPALKINQDVMFDRKAIQQVIKDLALSDQRPYLSYFLADGVYKDKPIIAKVKYKNELIESLVIEEITKKKRYRIDLSYDGTSYQGFQKQPHQETIQDTIEQCLNHLCQETIQIHPASRTDAKVHAYHQVIHFDTTSELTKDRIYNQLKIMLPRDIHIIDMQEVPQLFHARYDTLKKTYEYHLTKDLSPFLANHTAFVKSFDIRLAQKILQSLIGTHDFRGFAKANDKNNTVRTVHEVNISEDNSKVIITITGDGFLRHMVRMIIGHLFQEIKEQKGSFFNTLKHPEEEHRKYLAPAQALYLKKIYYTE